MIKKMKQIPDMKAIILAAGVGSRIRPMTDNCPKCLLEIGGVTILERMLSNIQACGINDVVFVLGYLQEQIEAFVQIFFLTLMLSSSSMTYMEKRIPGIL
jgi:NDP-sugar pyrophosphorylase family protein